MPIIRHNGGETMIVNTSRFGTIEVDESRLIFFPEGIPGFPDEERFLLLKQGLDDTPFWWLQSVDTGELCFLTVESELVLTGYDFPVPDEYGELLKLKGAPGLEALAIVTVRDGDLRKATANLRAPVLINPETRLGVQLILDNSQYAIRHPLFAEAEV